MLYGDIMDNKYCLVHEEDYINLDKDLFSALNLRDSLTKESVMINHVLHRIHDKKVW